MKPRITLAVVSAVLCGMAAGGPAWAGKPTVDDIIFALKPSDLMAPSRGIQILPPDEPGTPARARHRVRARSTGALDLTVNFPTGSAALTPAARSDIDNLGVALANPALAAYRFKIEGHTDTVGDDGENLKLSQARADTVAAYLEKTYGVSADRLEPVGMGKQGLAVPTADQVAEERNRRVHVVNLGKA